MSYYNISDLEAWNQRIRDKVSEFGLDCYDQEFDLCDSDQMMGHMAYSGMPAHYPHWSFGQAFERQKTFYEYGISGLPYEMVINSDPAIAYLMKDNSLLLQILTIAHVYGHNDFFKNNSTFKYTHARETINRTITHAARIRKYCADPSIGLSEVEAVIDAGHALMFQCRRSLAIRKLSIEEQKNRVWEKYFGKPQDQDAILKPAQTEEEKERQEDLYHFEVNKVPIEPEADVLLFIRDHSPVLRDWEKDILTIIHEEAQYFIPQIDTKIMNEGWASYWHKHILTSLKLSQDLAIEFAVRHSQVLRPNPYNLNPYHVGWTIWNAIRIYYDGKINPSLLNKQEFEPQLFEKMDRDFKERNAVPTDAGLLTGHQKLFKVRSRYQDQSFIRNFLTPVLIAELDLFTYSKKEKLLVIDKIAGDNEWQKIRDTLIAQIGVNSIPVIEITDADTENKRVLFLVHDFDGRELEAEYAQKTMECLRFLWGNDVLLQTVFRGKKAHYVATEKGVKVPKGALQ